MSKFISYKKEISECIFEFLDKKKLAHESSFFGSDVIARFKPLAVSGKMLRGSLLIDTYQQLSGKKYDADVLQTAAALELVGTALLVLDDVIDQDERRRGLQTLHVQYAQRAQAKKHSQSQKIGESLALCVSELVLFWVYELLPAAVVKLFSRQLAVTVLGEMHDVELSAQKDGVTLDLIRQMYLDKTASYTVSLPLMAGAVLAGQSQKLVVQLNDLGKTLGMIFQIKDDEIGLFGDPTKTGKAVGVDIREGKKTLYYYFLEKVAPGVFETGSVEKILELMKKHHIQQQVEAYLTQLEAKALQQIAALKSEKFKVMAVEFLKVNLVRKK